MSTPLPLIITACPDRRNVPQAQTGPGRPDLKKMRPH
jgi:hypothetical protein